MRSFTFLTLLSSPAWAATEAAQQVSGTWSPYVAGSLIGVLVCLTFYFSSEPVGASSFYATVSGLIGKAIAPNHTLRLQYFKENPPKVNWEFAFVLAAVLGSAAAALSGGEFAITGLPRMWVTQYGEGSWAQYAAISFFGGVLMAFGARLAGGCTSGHGISGAAQLSVSSWISLIFFFIGGVIAIRFIY
jgi:uncharacterized membrane protein YedE/YeeE